MTKQIRDGSLLLAALLITAGCGKPPAQQGGPPPDAPAMAVVAKVVQQRVEDTLELVASLEAVEEITVVSEITARVTDISFSEGEAVEAGQTFFRLDDVAATARLKEAEARFALAELGYKRHKELFENRTVSRQALDQAEAEHNSSSAALALARDETRKTVITAPFAGVVGECRVSVGQGVRVGDELTRLYSVDPIELTFNVPGRYLGHMQQDLVVTFSTAAYPDETFSGKVSYLAPRLDAASRTIRVKATIPNPERKLSPGMFGRLAIVFGVREQGLVIPESAIQLMGGGALVVRVNEAGISEFVPVQVGRRFAKQAEVLSGLAADDIIVVEGFQKMGPGMRVMATAGSEAYGVPPGPLFPQADAPQAAVDTTTPLPETTTATADEEGA
jgi:membrane fusion protein (multidrug efflux system)